ncbi:MAG: 50S ribosomal protein L17 [Candidatus Kerfeldbacteria bacterium RIFCSPHIGHO2_02_FULL_42_14]|uniref:50S ribosomal protein L17 n=1 Tax=Candidatus Kerfeldbacteria bacterium RIFCSPHIGHO2_02_FULL_42_14 TaxID=1798540 RepID=A0A1G2APZ1_9BACT|nr:MAG: 50S ribosomal protein L17 [Candidatus Kerfeldbacteria bacterium RIFCSPHIGHO2_02_FULL_42_14]OGY80632.1 MAG: 50S ribosomal protein L17 [Candidatus Kerfeldbacteria bacterium RIFCSPHIGHO2_12_FULL_42_13]OGY82556.1 MAG: 50S ribosomal protein L17 [Candidatus Kerfeldbacteria bacterium RIFCSPLOWO2_02_FULL_42_19]OGY85160.1 MAG: 50S ribosomal protein L17 [Candidatus Kerfeldbacteria bacterium RIFCSPLOWO2_12_FULL_43_9]
MRHRKRGKILDRAQSSRKALLRQMIVSFILHGRMQTTLAKAKVVQQAVEPLVTMARRNTLAVRRTLLKLCGTSSDAQQAVRLLLEKFGPKYAQRKGGYTRLVKGKVRLGDGAQRVFLEFIE